MLLRSPRPLLMTPFEISWTDLFSPEEHVLHIRQVLTGLLENELFVKAKKYELVVDSFFPGICYSGWEGQGWSAEGSGSGGAARTLESGTVLPGVCQFCLNWSSSKVASPLPTLASSDMLYLNRQAGLGGLEALTWGDNNHSSSGWTTRIYLTSRHLRDQRPLLHARPHSTIQMCHCWQPCQLFACPRLSISQVPQWAHPSRFACCPRSTTPVQPNNIHAEATFLEARSGSGHGGLCGSLSHLCLQQGISSGLHQRSSCPFQVEKLAVQCESHKLSLRFIEPFPEEHKSHSR